MASLSSPESRIKAAVQPGIKNQARCAGRNQESGPLRGPESRIKNHRGGGTDGPCACAHVLGFFRRPPCGERQGWRIGNS